MPSDRTLVRARAHADRVIPEFHRERCTDCGGCVGVCPVDAVRLFHGEVDLTDACIECDLCVKACPTGALTSDTWPPSDGEG